MTIDSWGRVFDYRHSITHAKSSADAHFDSGSPVLFHGLGRSYGDVALNDGGRLICTPHLDGVIDADWSGGIVRAEAGLSLNALLQACIPQGWIPPVMPGTRYVTMGGAVANDVHGKNHHQIGSFGTCVRTIGLRRSDGSTSILSRDENARLFALTLGGLGLTGFIEWVELQLAPIKSDGMIVENRPFDDLDGFFEQASTSEDWPYTVAWVDCLASGRALGRGIFTRARHDETTGPLEAGRAAPRLSMPLNLPGFALNRVSVGAFNRLYAARPGARFSGRQHFQPFFFPLDGIANWNRLYGKRGFFQHQSLLPPDRARGGLRNLLETISRAGQGSFLAVLKRYGPERSPGIMTFGGEGYSLALDFANKGGATRELLARLEDIVMDHGGRLYAAKDATQRPETFKAGYPHWKYLEAARDPAISSSFWRRVVPESLG